MPNRTLGHAHVCNSPSFSGLLLGTHLPQTSFCAPPQSLLLPETFLDPGASCIEKTLILQVDVEEAGVFPSPSPVGPKVP